MNIAFQQFNEIQNKSYSLDIIFLLKLVEEGVDVKSLCEKSIKLSVLYQSIYRKGLITNDEKLTLTGKELLEFINTEQIETKLSRRRNIDDDFEKWWKAYPGTDTFTYSGKSFTGTRSMRVKKDECKIQIYKILDQGDYTISELIKSLEFEVDQKKSNSVKTSTNKLMYMQNSLTYLNQRSFEPFIELIKQGIKIPTETATTGSTDI